jgi:hypothetical protein
MQIGLIDVDSKIPNLALMKLSAFYKNKGDNVEWAIPMLPYDRIYISKVFTHTNDFDTCLMADEIIRGGSGYDLKNKLDDAIEHTCPDYGLYGVKNTAYGFLSRGCPRACKFCIVSEKVANLKEFWNGQKEIVVLDPNLLACNDKYDLLQQLIDSKAWIDINQGLDARFLTDKSIHCISKLKIKMLHFAWDNVKEEAHIIPKLKEFKEKTNFDFRKLRVYVLTNYNSTFEEDIYRVEYLKNIGYDPYVMIFNKPKAPKQIKKLQRWVNNKFIFRSCDNFNDYQKQNIRTVM